MKGIRNSVKAIIIEEGKLLLTKCDFGDGKPSYLFSGGGQEPGETFIETLKRECIEELGAKVSVGELAWIREYIGKNHEFAEQDQEVHQVEYYFICTLDTPVDLAKATNLDVVQTGVEWINLTDLEDYNIYPKAIREHLDTKGNILPPVYAGDVN